MIAEKEDPKRCYVLKSGKTRERTSWISALREKQIFTPLTFEGLCNRDLFEFWLEHCLIPQLELGDILSLIMRLFIKGKKLENWWKKQVVKFGIYHLIHLI